MKTFLSYGNRQHELRVSRQVGYVAVQGDVFLRRAGLADGQGHSQDGVGPELSCSTGWKNLMCLYLFHFYWYF